MASRNRNRNKNQDDAIEISSSTESEEQAAQSDVDEEEEGSDDSQDEYQPPIKLNDSKTATTKSRSKRKRVEESDEEDDDEQEDQFVELDDSDLEEFQSSNKKKSKSQSVKKSKIPKDRNTKPSSSSHDRKKKTGKGKSKAQNSDDDDLVSDEDQEPSFYHKELAQAEKLDSEEEREDSIRAQEAWAAVKARKEGKPIPPSKLKPPKDSTSNSNSNSNANGSNALTSWLGLPDEDSIPWPISCPEAQIQDRDSTFIAYCYPLTKMSDLPLILTHLTKKVHPLVPINLLPIQFQSVPANKRGSSHDMHAYSFLVLKRGRDGRDGPEDYTLKEGKEDDGEKWSSMKIENIIRQEGASDVVCIVSRWYGGTMLGPIRFTHIENVARAAIKRFIDNETIEPLRQQIQDLDAKILDLRKTLNPPTSESPAKPLKINDYPDLTMEKAEKLMKARNATFSYLEKQLASTSKPKSTSTSTSNPNHTVSPEKEKSGSEKKKEEEHARMRVVIAKDQTDDDSSSKAA